MSMDTPTKVFFIILAISLGLIYVVYLTYNEIWIIFLFVLLLLIIISGLLYFFDKKYPKSEIVKVLENIKKLLEQAFP